MNHGTDEDPAVPPYPRESGILVSTDEYGRELRIHRVGSVHHLNQWRRFVEPPLRRKDNDQRWICSVVWGLTAEQLIACGEAMKGVSSPRPPA